MSEHRFRELDQAWERVQAGNEELKEMRTNQPMKTRILWNLDLNHARLLRDMIGVAQYDCKQEVLGALEVMYAEINRLITKAER
jgi:hypothetical protein